MKFKLFVNGAHMIMWILSHIYFLYLVITALTIDAPITNLHLLISMVLLSVLVSYEVKLNRK